MAGEGCEAAHLARHRHRAAEFHIGKRVVELGLRAQPFEQPLRGIEAAFAAIDQIQHRTELRRVDALGAGGGGEIE